MPHSNSDMMTRAVETLFSLFFFVSGSLLITLSNAQQTECTVCRDGASVALPAKNLVLSDPYASVVQTCGDLDALAPLLLAIDSIECQAIQSVGTYCGCPVPENACQFCETETGIQGTNTTATNTANPVLVDPQTVVDFPLIPSDVIVPNCGIIQAYLHSIPRNTDDCNQWQQEYRNICPCTSSSSSNSNSNSNSNTTTANPPSQSTQETGNVVDGPTSSPNVGADTNCGICTDGAQMTFPDKDVAYLVGDFLTDEYATLFTSSSSNNNNNDTSTSLSSSRIISCQMLDSILQVATTRGDATCTDAQFLLGGPCGCPTPLKNPCQFCPQGVPDPDRIVYTTTLAGFPPSKCQDIQLFYQYSIDASEGFCKEGQNSLEYLCDCSEEILYLGAKSKRQKAWLAWLPRLTSLLSILGSLFILYEIVGLKIIKQTTNSSFSLTMFDELLASISILDLIYSLGMALSTWPVPEYAEFGEPTGIYGAHGTEWSCTLQGVVIQIGLTGLAIDLLSHGDSIELVGISCTGKGPKVVSCTLAGRSRCGTSSIWRTKDDAFDFLHWSHYARRVDYIH
eukprot:scaffold3048_cov192-Amphora_coffeaeformis.AAC.8